MYLEEGYRLDLPGRGGEAEPTWRRGRGWTYLEEGERLDYVPRGGL